MRRRPEVREYPRSVRMKKRCLTLAWIKLHTVAKGFAFSGIHGNAMREEIRIRHPYIGRYA